MAPVFDLRLQVSGIYKPVYVIVCLKLFMVFPRIMSLVAKQQVMKAGHVQELALKYNDMTSEEKHIVLTHHQRGF